MSTSSETIFQEAIFMKNGDANLPALHLHVIGFGTVCQVVSTRIRAHYASQINKKFDEIDSEILQCDELFFIVIDLNFTLENKVGEIVNILNKYPRGKNILITIFEDIGVISNEEKFKALPLNFLNEIDAHFPMISAYAIDEKIIGQDIFDRIRSIEMNLTKNDFGINFEEFKTVLIDGGFGRCTTGYSCIQPMWGEGRGKDRAMYAVARALAHPSCIELSQADGVILLVKASRAHLKSGELKLISAVVRNNVSKHCSYLTSICYENDFSSEALVVELWVSKLAKETRMLQMTGRIAEKMAARRNQSR